MHLKRWLSGLILAIGLILIILHAPPWLFFLILFLLMVLGLQEFYRLTGPAISPGLKKVGPVLSSVLALGMFYPDPRGLAVGLLGAVFFWSMTSLFQREMFSLRVQQVSIHLLGLLYVVFLLGHFGWMRELPQGKTWILFTLVAVYVGDTTAFYIGRTWGKRALAPNLSPKKTVEGAMAAVGGSIAGALFFRTFFFPALGIGEAILLGAAIGTAGQMGDLFESLLKRSAQVKDSGGLIPGHGGLLDRIDSVLFAGPLAYYYALFFFR